MIDAVNIVEIIVLCGHYEKRVGTRSRNLKKKEKGLDGRGRLTDTPIYRL